MKFSCAFLPPIVLLLAGMGFPVRAESIELTGLPTHMNCGQTCVLTARHRERPDTRLCWSVKGDLGAGSPQLLPDGLVLTPQADGSAVFRAPRLGEQRTFWVRAANAARPDEFQELPVWIWPLGKEPLEVFSSVWPLRDALAGGESVILTVRRCTGQVQLWDWSLTSGDATPEATLARALVDPRAEGTVRVVVPQVGRRTELLVTARNPAFPAQGVSCALPIRPRFPSAQVRITGVPEPPHAVPAGEPCTLGAVHEDGIPRRWRWSVVGLEASALTPLEDGRRTVLPPPGARARTCWIRVENEADPLEFTQRPLRVGASAPPEGLPPVLTPFAGSFVAAPGLEGFHFDRIVAVRAVGEGVLGGRGPGYLVNDRHGLHFVDLHGAVSPLLDARTLGEAMGTPGNRHLGMTAVAVRPPGSAAGNPRRVVFAVESLDGLVAPGCSFLFELDGEGRAHLLGGGAAMKGAAWGGNNLTGHARAVHFGRIGSLALDDVGNLFVGDEGLGMLRRVDPDGVVTNLAWSRGCGLLGGSPGLGGPLRGLTVDPASGDLYCAGYSAILKVDLHRKVVPVLHIAEPACSDEPLDLAFQDTRLFVADPARNCIHILNPVDRTTDTVVGVADDPEPGSIRLALRTPETGPAAFLRRPRALCPGPGGTLVVVQGDLLSRLDLDWVPRRPTLPAPAEDKAPAAPELPEEPPPPKFRFGKVATFTKKVVVSELKPVADAGDPFGPRVVFTKRAVPGEREEAKAPAAPSHEPTSHEPTSHEPPLHEPFGPKAVFTRKAVPREPPAPVDTTGPFGPRIRFKEKGTS